MIAKVFIPILGIKPFAIMKCLALAPPRAVTPASTGPFPPHSGRLHDPFCDRGHLPLISRGFLSTITRAVKAVTRSASTRGGKPRKLFSDASMYMHRPHPTGCPAVQLRRGP